MARTGKSVLSVIHKLKGVEDNQLGAAPVFAAQIRMSLRSRSGQYPSMIAMESPASTRADFALVRQKGREIWFAI